MTTDRDLLRLAPCPFCGCRDIFINDPSDAFPQGCINCPACLAVMPGATSDRNELTRAWNTRAISAEPCAVKALEFMSYTRSVLDECKNDFNRCPQCDFEDNDATKHSDLFLLLTRKLEELGELPDQRIRSALVPGGAAAAYRWRVKGATNWVYDPDQNWLDRHQNDPDVDVELLYAHPAPPSAAVREALSLSVSAFDYIEQSYPNDPFIEQILNKIKALSGLGESSTSSDGATRPVDYDTNDPMGVEIDEPAADRERIAREVLEKVRDYLIPRAKFINGDPTKKNAEHILLDQVESNIDRLAILSTGARR